MELFDQGEYKTPKKPLADRLRPVNLEQFVGQTHILAVGKPLYESIKADRVGEQVGLTWKCVNRVLMP